MTVMIKLARCDRGGGGEQTGKSLRPKGLAQKGEDDDEEPAGRRLDEDNGYVGHGAVGSVSDLRRSTLGSGRLAAFSPGRLLLSGGAALLRARP